jgi:hypothetical protein
VQALAYCDHREHDEVEGDPERDHVRDSGNSKRRASAVRAEIRRNVAPGGTISGDEGKSPSRFEQTDHVRGGSPGRARAA